MKAHVFIPTFLLCIAGTQLSAKAAIPAKADSTGMPGDNLDLYAVLDQFKRSNDLESFERSINDPGNKINNLDLNQDGETDYIRVVDYADSGAHAIVLQVPINEQESQDVAVIEVEQEGTDNASIRVVGDDEVYGEDYVVEPYEKYVGKEEYDAQYSSRNTNYSQTRVVVNVWMWPCVTYIYRPVYRPWRSPWYWGYYPGWWRPWRPHHWHAYHGHMAHYHGPSYCYHRTQHYGYGMRTAGRVYHHRRTTSATYQRSSPRVVRNTSAHHPRVRDNNHRIPNEYGRHRANPGRQQGQHVGGGHHNRQRAPQQVGGGHHNHRQQGGGNYHQQGGGNYHRQQGGGNYHRQRAPQQSRQHGGGGGGARHRSSGHRR